jgi:MFS family permease
LGILRDSSAPSTPFAFFFGHFPEANDDGKNDGGKNSGHNVVTDFVSPIVTGFAALVTAFSPLLLFLLERHKKASDKSWPRRTAEVLIVFIAALCLGYLLYLFAYLILLFICAFMVCSSVMIAAVAYAYGTFKEMELRERAFNRDQPPAQMSG